MPRARYLGMIVGVAISRLVDEAGKVMDFGTEEMESEEGKAWLSLVNIHDKIGNLEDLRPAEEDASQSLVKPKRSAKKPKPAPRQPTTSKIISITELPDNSPSSPDLPPYAKPDSDPSDSEEDATLINRSKPIAPVYILDLVKNLNMTDSPETVQLALKTAPSLIRRKANFGTELSENLDRLASSLLNLNESMSKVAPQKQRLQALIALVVAEPTRMGPWLSAMYFEGDLSLIQRATLLTAIGLGCRELAGYAEPESDPKTNDISSKATNFPSKKLPPNLSAIYDPINTLTKTLSQTTIQPLALAAADTLTGPNILKTRTFSSRLTLAKSKPNRQTPIPKNLHTLLTTSFLLPLTTRLHHTLSSTTSRSSSPSVLTPHLLSLSLRTLLLLQHTIGPHTTHLPTTTHSTLSLLLTLHSQPISTDPTILPPTLALLLCILDLNTVSPIAEERLITDFGTQIAELMAWVAGLVNAGKENIPTMEGEGEGMPWTALAAGCQVKWQEVGRKFQGRMVGLTSGEMDGF
jgi:telomere length regulation protein